VQWQAWETPPICNSPAAKLPPPFLNMISPCPLPPHTITQQQAQRPPLGTLSRHSRTHSTRSTCSMGTTAVKVLRVACGCMTAARPQREVGHTAPTMLSLHKPEPYGHLVYDNMNVVYVRCGGIVKITVRMLCTHCVCTF